MDPRLTIVKAKKKKEKKKKLSLHRVRKFWNLKQNSVNTTLPGAVKASNNGIDSAQSLSNVMEAFLRLREGVDL